MSNKFKAKTNTKHSSWTVNGNIARHTSGVVATAKVNDKDPYQIDCNLSVPTKLAKNNQIDIGALIDEVGKLVIDGKLTYEPDEFDGIAYDIPEDVAQQYQGTGYVIAATSNNKVKAIKYLRDVLSKEEYDSFIYDTISKDKKSLGVEKLQRVAAELMYYGDVKSGFCEDNQFYDFSTAAQLANPGVKNKS